MPNGHPRAHSSQHQRVTLEVLEPGTFTTVQDLGRVGLARLGVGSSGACDREALRRANRLVGNPEGAAALEATLGGLCLLARGFATVAVTGAPGPVLLDGAPVAMATPLHLRDGAELGLGPPEAGLRTYVAVHGGIGVAPVLGSRSYDVLAGIGPPPLRPGDELVVGTSVERRTRVDIAPGRPVAHGDVELRVTLGPRADWFTPESVHELLGTSYTVSSDSNRIGVRLHGAALVRASGRELPSEGLLPGAIQVPPSGAPVLLLADHPVTGGYPVVAVVRDADLDAAGQLRPGQRVRLRRTGTDTRLSGGHSG